MSDRKEQQEQRYARALAWGLGLSVAGHVLLFVLFSARPLPLSPFAAAGGRMGDIRAAEGGGMEAVQLATPQRALEPPPPLPAPTPDVTEVTMPEPELDAEDIPAIALDEQVATPGSEGPAEGPGLAEGDGQGDGGTEAEGRFRVVPPRPKGMILPPSDRPDEVRGKEVDVWVYVAASGQVVADSTRLDPPTGDRGFDRRLREYASDWVFGVPILLGGLYLFPPTRRRIERRHPVTRFGTVQSTDETAGRGRPAR